MYLTLAQEVALRAKNKREQAEWYREQYKLQEADWEVHDDD